MQSDTLNHYLADEAATLRFAQHLAAVTPAVAWYYFSGPLGAGKTCLIRGLLQACGVTGAIHSPTFSLIEAYHANDQKFYHFDCYRLRTAAELMDIGYRDYFAEQAVILLEWPEHGAGVLPEADCQITIQVEKHARQLSLRPLTARGASILANLNTQVSIR
jgi:tRNA threonylcarbamoyladenosine biosynthesis protein TsaE